MFNLRERGNPSPGLYPGCGDRTATSPHSGVGRKGKEIPLQVTRGKRNDTSIIFQWDKNVTVDATTGVEDNSILFALQVLYIRTQMGKEQQFSLLLSAVSSRKVQQVLQRQEPAQPPPASCFGVGWGLLPPCAESQAQPSHKADTYGHPTSTYRELVPESGCFNNYTVQGLTSSSPL